MPVYTLLMDETPQPMQPALPDPTAVAPANPTVYDPIPIGLSSGLAYGLNKNSRRSELTASLGGGAIGVGDGCALSVSSGLTVALSAGYVNIGGWIRMAAKALVLANNTRSYLWLSRTGDLSARTDLTQPLTTSAYLGSVLTAAGAITEIDYSGRDELRGIPFRRTADLGEPNAALPSWWRGIVRTGGGIYWWDGTDYHSTLDAKTVYTSLDHDTSGALADLLVAEDGASIDLEETSPGVWQLVLRNTDPGSAAQNDAVKVDGGDTTPGSLSEKLLFSEDFSATLTGPDPGNRTLHVSLNPHVEVFTLSVANADLPPGESRLVKVDFLARGSFAASDYAVEIIRGATSDTRYLVIEEVLAVDAPGVQSKSQNHFLLRIYNATPAITGASSSPLPLTVTLRGFGWVAGGTPAATPTITYHPWEGRHVEEFTVRVTVPVGEARIVKVDFSLRGTYSDDFHVRAAVDQDPAKTLVSRVDGYESGFLRADGFFDGTQGFGVLYLSVQNATDAVAGDYYGAGELELSLRLEGTRWRAGAGGTPAVTVTEFQQAPLEQTNWQRLGVFYIADTEPLDQPAWFGMNNAWDPGNLIPVEHLSSAAIVTRLELQFHGLVSTFRSRIFLNGPTENYFSPYVELVADPGPNGITVATLDVHWTLPAGVNLSGNFMSVAAVEGSGWPGSARLVVWGVLVEGAGSWDAELTGG